MTLLELATYNEDAFARFVEHGLPERPINPDAYKDPIICPTCGEANAGEDGGPCWDCEHDTTCSVCWGTGREFYEPADPTKRGDWRPCHNCDGTGEVK